MDRSFRHKTNKKILTLNDILYQVNLIVIYGTFHSKGAEKIFFSSEFQTFFRIDRMLGHKTSLSKFKKMETISIIFLTTME